jgi:hypothetical protein
MLCRENSKMTTQFHWSKLYALVIRHWQLVFSFFWALGLVAISYGVFNPGFQTNDDVVMAMRVHGFGQFVAPTPYIVYSNILWGLLLYILPSIAGYLAYAWMTVLILACCSWGITYFIVRSAIPLLFAVLLSTFVLINPLLHPQFTVTAGLCAVVSVLAVKRYLDCPSRWLLAVIVLGAIGAILIRVIMLPLVFVVAVPFIVKSYHSILSRTPLRSVVIGIVSFGFFSLVANWWAYQQSPEMALFHEQYRLYQPLFNNGAGQFFKQHATILSSSGYSPNDIYLMAQRFFVPGSLTDTIQLRRLMEQYSVWGISSTTLRGLLVRNFSIYTTQFFAVILSIIIVGMLWQRNAKTLYALGLLALVTVVISVTGRIFFARVIFSMLVVILLLMIVHFDAKPWKNIAVTITCSLWLLVALTLQANSSFQSDSSFSKRSAALIDDLQKMPTQSIVVWGALPFSYNHLYPLRAMRADVAPLEMHTLALATIQPQSVAYEQRMQGFDFNTVLRSDEGVLISYFPFYRNRIKLYCHEHFGMKLQEDFFWKGKIINIQRIRCIPQTP